MKLNFEKIIKQNLPKNILQPRRAQIYVGFQCHQKCGFCYYKYRCNEQMFPIDYVKKQIDFEYEYGIRDFEITGGEPSEYKQLREVCQYIKTKNNDSKIAVITNGGLWKCNIWDLIDEVLVSYHLGRNCNYDKEIFPLGCTYDKVKKTIDLAKQTNKLIRTNTVCATFNLDILDNVIDDLIEFKPNIVNFLPVNLFDQAQNMYQYINYNKLRYVIKKQINKFNIYHNCDINIRYMPFCDMEGYTQYVVGNLHHIYDWFDWNRELNGIQILEMINNYNKALKKLGKYGSTSLKTIINSRNIFYTKTKKCLKCKYLIICDGIEKTKYDQLVDYIKPAHGKIEKNITFFIKKSYIIYNNYYEKK